MNVPSTLSLRSAAVTAGETGPIRETLAYDLHPMHNLCKKRAFFIGEAGMSEEPFIVHHPLEFLWGVAVRAAARSQFKISLQCESAFKARLKLGLETNSVGANEFTKRRTEAQSNIEKLIRAMIDAQMAKDPTVDVINEWTILHVLGHDKLCPGLWPVC